MTPSIITCQQLHLLHFIFKVQKQTFVIVKNKKIKKNTKKYLYISGSFPTMKQYRSLLKYFRIPKISI